MKRQGSAVFCSTAKAGHWAGGGASAASSQGSAERQHSLTDRGCVPWALLSSSTTSWTEAVCPGPC